MRVTRQWVTEHASLAGGWNKQQLDILGVGWPPGKGWLTRLVGTVIADKDIAQFERVPGRKKKKSIYRTNLLSTWLREFWEQAPLCESRGDRLLLVVAYAGKSLPQSRSKSKQKGVRASFRQSRAGRYAAWSASDLEQHIVCFVCWRAATLEHHIVQIQHGGDNRKANRLPVCAPCHADVHPWLKAKSARA